MMRAGLILAAFLLLPLPALAQLHSIINGAMPALPGDPDKDDTSPVVCREPQRQTDSRIPGPRVCRTKRQWDDLHAKGLDISADGRGVVASEKYRSLNPQACGYNGAC